MILRGRAFIRKWPKTDTTTRCMILMIVDVDTKDINALTGEGSDAAGNIDGTIDEHTALFVLDKVRPTREVIGCAAGDILTSYNPEIWQRT